MIDLLLFNKDYSALDQQLNNTNNKLIDETYIFFEVYIREKIKIHNQLRQKDQLDFAEFSNKVKEINTMTKIQQNIEESVEKCILKKYLTFFIAEIPYEYEKQIHSKIKNLPPLRQILATRMYKNIEQKPYYATSLLELYIQKLLIPQNENSINDILYLIDFHNKIYTKLKSEKKYKNFKKLYKKLFYIVIHKLIYYNNINLKLPNAEALKIYINLFKEQSVELMNNKLKICLLYNILKIMIGIDNNSVDIFQILAHFKIEIQLTSFEQKIFALFSILNKLIDEKSQRNLSEYKKKQNGEEERTPFWNQLYIYLNINFTELINKLNHLVKSIITYRIPSLLSFISEKFKLRNINKQFVEKLFNSPFNGDIQTMKLCGQLFLDQQFVKLYQLVQTVLSSTDSKKLQEREVLIAMCSITIGVLMQNRQEGLVFAKLNHFEYQKYRNKSDCILNEQTLIQHIGFAYYNLGVHSVYLQNKITYYAKALENFLKSYEINKQNYLLNYSIAKLYLENYDYENAYKFSKIACQNNKDNWQPFALLACVYMCQKRSHKADIIIKELILRHKNCSNLYYIKAYCEVYKLLQQVNQNEQVEASKFLGDEYFESFKQKYLRNKQTKQVTHIIVLLQRYYKLNVLGSSEDLEVEYDQNFFNKIKLDQQKQNEVIYLESLRKIFNLLIQIDQIPLCEVLVKKMFEVHKNKKNIENKYYKAMLHQKKKEMQQAIEQYTEILQINPYHPETLIKLSLLQTNVNKAHQHIQLASKFRDNDDYNFAMGMILSRNEDYELAHSYFLKEAHVCWLQFLPDFMYYY